VAAAGGTSLHRLDASYWSQTGAGWVPMTCDVSYRSKWDLPLQHWVWAGISGEQRVCAGIQGDLCVGGCPRDKCVSA